MKIRLILLLCCLPAVLLAEGRKSSELNGQWTFAVDPMKTGEQQKWFENIFPSDKFDKVKVPHCFSVDPRYMFYTGTAWYFKRFDAVQANNGHVFVKFDAVFYKSKIWLNGNLLGEHEGGYTPFEFDITKYLKAENVLAVQVSNAWDTTTIPGAKTLVPSSSENAGQLYPWINYGGLTRTVHLVTRPDVYVSNVKIVAEPDLKQGDASVHITALIKNVSASAQKATVNAFVWNNDKQSNIKFKPVAVNVDATGNSKVEFAATMPASEVKLWNQDEPNLYVANIIAGDDTLSTRFGIRKLEVSGTKLLLNGEPIKMGGCNRPLDYPGFGSMDPQQVLDQDLALIKGGAMELSRINHYPVSEYMLDWADKNGLLIIEEAGNWQMTPKQMNDTMMRRKFQSQMREMVERDWNHPSVVAYSVGNEFQSQKGEGKAWVRDMSSFVKSLDNSRLITFASMIVFRDFVKKPEDEASQYVDFVSANIYTDHLKHLQHIHDLYPNKPVYVSEFGIRADEGKTELERVQHLKKAMEDFRQCDFLVGASVWTFNDYFSRFPGTGPNGYRAWGLVSPEREKRDMYIAWQEEFAPATIELLNKQGGKATISVTARKDFPSYTMKGYTIRYNNKDIRLNTLHPGESHQIVVDLPSGEAEVELVKPGGFVILKKIMK